MIGRKAVFHGMDVMCVALSMAYKYSISTLGIY